MPDIARTEIDEDGIEWTIIKVPDGHVISRQPSLNGKVELLWRDYLERAEKARMAAVRKAAKEKK